MILGPSSSRTVPRISFLCYDYYDESGLTIS
jgi:hypothetical protein